MYKRAPVSYKLQTASANSLEFVYRPQDNCIEQAVICNFPSEHDWKTRIQALLLNYFNQLESWAGKAKVSDVGLSQAVELRQGILSSSDLAGRGRLPPSLVPSSARAASLIYGRPPDLFPTCWHDERCHPFWISGALPTCPLKLHCKPSDVSVHRFL